MKFCQTLLFLIILVFSSCMGQKSGSFEELNSNQFAEKINAAEKPQILDVRTPDEFASEHIDNAINLNWNSADFETQAANYDKSKPVYVYCLSGGRSNKAAKKLTELGFSKVYELEGGILKWKADGMMEKPSKPNGMTMEDFNKLLQTDKKVLIDFTAVWCGPCKKMKPYLLKMQKEMADQVTVIQIDVDKNKTLASQMKIDQLPTIIIYENQKIKWQNIGYISEQDLKKQLQ